MQLTPKIQAAIYFAAKYHDGQYRKGVHLPYIVHPFSVALILSEYTEDEDIILAGLLHDTIEDTKATKEDLIREFGPRVTQIVLDVTEDKKASLRERKLKYIEHLKVSEEPALLVSAADKIHNISSSLMFADVSSDKISVGDKFWFYEAVFNAISSRLKNPIVKEYKEILAEAKLSIK